MSRTIYGQLHRRFGVRESGASRRDFLKGMAAAGAAMLLSSCAHTEKTKEEMAASQHVIVVGAGFAGLACAYELRMAGYNVTVIDGRDRLGGRVLSFTDFIPKRVIEGGGELIGTNHPLWAAYAGKFRLDLVDISEDESLDAPLVVEGKALSREEAKKLYDEMTTVLATMNEDARNVVADEPWETPDAQALDRRATSAWLESTNASALCKAAIKAQLEGNNAVPLARQSYLGNLAQVKGGGVEKYWTDTENRHCKQGNQELANQFADGIGQNNILLSTTVDNISVANLSVIVTTSDGLTLDAHDVVLAAPPSTWSKIGFVPMLPADLQPQMGMAVKYLAEVKSRFWEAAKLSAEGQGDGPVSMTWESTKGQGGTKSAGLTAFSGSAAAEECRQVHISKRDAFYARAIEQMYPGFGEQFVKSRFMDWPTDPLARCSYSFPAPGQITTIGPVLHEGLGRLHFAGEHTCYKFVGYMEGALDSGVRIARKLARRDGINPAGGAAVGKKKKMG